ncbi:MAG: hypothetical protein CMQ46_15120 [Gammaproteobacteria bacterium]|nr:hypothetical protein [Gammaproteobacteria bacterium]MBJ56574.1 hypothetical protein [Gammaproteobacteria bacterium]HBN14737.1 YceI family protein [Pseudohongiella sp.]|tara:strand:+ start:2177 stop:2782 length:606 start_codon:yes stop_codon:yes gene_type:complete
MTLMQKENTMLRQSLSAIVLLAGLLIGSSAMAQWTLDNDQSKLSFVTIKADHVAEVHTFDRLAGSINASGEVSITIELASINSLIPIRDERMQAMLFETNLFPEAMVSGSVDIADLRAMEPGESRALTLDVSLDLRGDARDYPAEILVTRTQNGVVASTLKPILVTADNHTLAAGVEALREIAGLPSISRAVPVSFTVVFE